MRPDSRILISGAGVSGLAAAIWLGRAGFRPVVMEKADSIRAGGYLVSLSEQAYHFATEMGLTERLRAYDIGITASSYHAKSGRSILDLDYGRMFGDLSVIQMMRDDFVQVLFEEARELAEFRYSDTIASVDQTDHPDDGANVTFASGHQERFDVVIGADGLHSSVRGAVFDESEFTRHRLGLYCAAFRLPNVLGISNKFETHMEQDRYMAAFTTSPAPDADLGAVFVWSGEAVETPPRAERHDFLLDAFAGTNAAIGKVLAECPTDNSFYMDALAQIEMPTWHRGASVVMGDAAHCLTLFSGRGAAAAFTGAGRLSKALIEEDSVAAAFARYERETRPIIDVIQPATRKAVKWYVPRNPAIYWARDLGMRLAPNALFRNYFRFKYSQV